MSTLIILLAQTKGVAIIEILSLLLVAAIIGYITSWLYHKSIYVKNMKAIESEKDELKNQICKLDTDHSNLDKSLNDKEIEIEILKRRFMRLKHFMQRLFLKQKMKPWFILLSVSTYLIIKVLEQPMRQKRMT